MSKRWILPIIIFIMLITSTSGKTGQVNILVLGQFEGQFETVMINMYQTGSSENRILSIPPGAVFFDGTDLIREEKLVDVLQREGITPIRQALSEYLELSIPYYLIVDYAGAQGVVDAMGGVYFNLPRAMRLPAEGNKPALNLEAGMQLFDGDTARRFLRYRTEDLHGPEELKIIELQQRFLDAMIRQLAQEKRKIIPVAMQLPKMIKTNIGIFELLNLAYDAVKIDVQALKVYFGVLPGNFTKVNGQYQYRIRGMRGYRIP